MRCPVSPQLPVVCIRLLQDEEARLQLQRSDRLDLVLLGNCACCLNPGPNPHPMPLLQVPVEQQEVQANLRLNSDGTSDVMRKSMLKRQTFENFERVKNRELNVVEGACD